MKKTKKKPVRLNQNEVRLCLECVHIVIDKFSFGKELRVPLLIMTNLVAEPVDSDGKGLFTKYGVKTWELEEKISSMSKKDLNILLYDMYDQIDELPAEE